MPDQWSDALRDDERPEQDRVSRRRSEDRVWELLASFARNLGKTGALNSVEAEKTLQLSTFEELDDLSGSTKFWVHSLRWES